MANEGLAGPGVSTPGTASGSNNVQVSFSRGSIKYDSPFLDMTSTFVPKTIKGILRFVSAYVVGDGLVAQCISKMSEYPITKLLYNEEKKSSIKDDNTINKWKELLEKKIKIVRVMKQSGMDYYAYGNSIVSINYPFKRMLECKRCNCKRPIDGFKKVSFKTFKFYAKCLSDDCGYDGEMGASDVNTKEVEKLNVVHWDLTYMNIKYNSITGDHFYFYTIPPDLGASIRRGDMDIVNSTRLEVIEAVKKRKQLKLMSDNVFHLKRPAPQYLYPSERGWGIPVIMPVMKDIFHCKVLKKGNEMIAFDHIVPLRILFPQGTGDVSPHATINLGGWRDKVDEEIRQWRADPNRISIVPLPIGMQNMSGDAKILSVTPELKATEDSIITGIGIIPEIIRGGASWSGSNVSLRVVENTFLNHRNDMHSLIDFVVENVARFMGYPKISIKMADFKMADDLEKKRLMIQATQGRSSQSLVSRTTAIKELGFDPEEEYKNRSGELKETLELMVQESEGEAEAQGAGMLINANYQAEAEIDQKNRMEMHDRESEAKRNQSMMEERDMNAQGVEQEVAALSERSGHDGQKISTPNLLLILTQRFARLSKIDQEEFKIRMLAMKNSMPALYQEIYSNLKEMNLIVADTLPDLKETQKYTPGEIPSYNQAGQFAGEPASPIEQGANPGVVQSTDPNYTLPEARPPSSNKSPI